MSTFDLLDHPQKTLKILAAMKFKFPMPLVRVSILLLVATASEAFSPVSPLALSRLALARSVHAGSVVGRRSARVCTTRMMSEEDQVRPWLEVR